MNKVLEFSKAQVQNLAMQGSVVDWTSLTDSELGSEITKSFTALELLSRKAQAELRGRLLPALQEVRRRFKQGQLVGGAKGIEEVYRSIGLNPNTLYSWEFRTREAARLMENALNSKSEAPDEEEEEEVDNEDDSYSDADLAADLAARRERREKDYDGSRRWEREQAAKKQAIVKAAKDIISAGKKALALKAHPDHGGSEEAMQNINAAAVWLLKLVNKEEQ